MIGFIPTSEFAKDLNITNEKGYIKTNEKMQTEVQGIYAVGDIRDKEIRQIVTVLLLMVQLQLKKFGTL
nr:FAD-dependent oxidoreductase [Mycoplasmopsis bovis]